MSEYSIFTSESVSEGHPDKIADQISDAVLDAIIAQDKHARVACETLVKTGVAIVAGEVTTSAWVDLEQIVRDVICDIGYTSSEVGFDGGTCGVINIIGKQSVDIAQGVDRAKPEDQGAGDQGLMFGYACDETPELMPLPIRMAHRLAEQLTAVRRDEVLDYLRPDGKTQVTIDYDDQGHPIAVDTIVVSAQHRADVDVESVLIPDIQREVIAPVLAEYGFENAHPRMLINPTGRFVTGGPAGDAGLTGRKIIVDTYGGMARHGGGAFSGKDPSKVDRSAAYAVRWIAKNVVAAGLARRCEVQVSYAIGTAKPTSLYVDTFGTGAVPDRDIEQAVRAVFDLRPAAIVAELGLRHPIYSSFTCYGHFGRELPGMSWELTNRADELARRVRG